MLKNQGEKRIPISGMPSNIEAEKSVLGSLLLDGGLIHNVVGMLKPEDFHMEVHREIFASMLRLVEKGKPLDILTLAEEMEGIKAFVQAGEADYLSSLIDHPPDILNIETYARIIKEKAILRELMALSHDLTRHCRQPEVEVENLLDEAESRIFQISEDTIQGGFVPLRDVVLHTIKEMEASERGKGLVTGIPSGFTKLDELTTGFHPGDLVYIAGRPGMGKTAFALSMALYMALKKNHAVGFFSLEMSQEQLGMRLLCSQAQLDLSKMRAGYLSKEDLQKIIASADNLKDAPIYIDDSPILDILDMRAKARKLKREHQLDVLMIDYIQLMRADKHGKRRFENRNLELGEISRNLKILAKELHIPVIALSQLSRQTERRAKDARPQLADLRESGNLEQDADLVIFLYRDELYNENSPHKGMAEVIIGKQRNGPTGSFYLVFFKEYTLFMNRDPREEL